MTPLHERLRDFVEAELFAEYDHCHIAGELQQLSDELVSESISSSVEIKRSQGLKLTAEIARQVRASTEPGKELAARFGVSQATISHIRREHTWRDA